MNTTRNVEEKNSKDSDFDYYLQSGLPAQQLAALLRAQGKDQKDIDSFMEKYEASRKKISKVVKRFVEKMEVKYGHLDLPELMRKGMKHATKHGFTPAEKQAFLNYVKNGDTETPYLPFQDLGYTEMSKFLGFSNVMGQTLGVKATDQPALQEIARLYETSKLIHSGIRYNLVTYTDCDPNAIGAQFNKEKDNLSIYVHPLLVALFLVKINAIDRRMLYSNIGRFVVQRSQAYFQRMDDKKTNAKYMNWHLSLNDLLPNELPADLEFMYDIAKDPNSLDHFSEESPMNNLLKRFNVQIELWKNVLALRQGKFYSRSENYTDDNGIMGLHKVLSSYSWTYFDSPDMFHVHDEGTLLRKLLAVFSFRPTLTQISSYASRSTMGYSNMAAISKATFVHTTVCNVRLPTTVIGTADPSAPAIRLTQAMSKSDWFIENKMLVPKNTSIIHSRSVIFFYVNRRYQSPLANVDMGFRYLSVPGTVSGLTNINTTKVFVERQITLQSDKFDLTSVVVLNPLLQDQFATGCSSLVVMPAKGGQSERYYYYNPLGCSIMYDKAGKYVRNDPISPIPEHAVNGENVGFVNMAEKYGTIFVYVNNAEEVKPC